MPKHLICVVALAILIPVSGVLGVRLALLWQEILARVNEKRTPEERSSPLFWHAGNSVDLINHYRRLYPDGPLLRRYLIALGLMLSLFVIAAASLLLCFLA